MDAELFRAITLEDMKMPAGWSVGGGQTYLYTPAERGLMLRARAFAQQELAPQAAATDRKVKEIKARFSGLERREKLREIAKGYLRSLATAGLSGALYPEQYGGSGAGVVAECIIDEELGAVGHPGDTIRSASLVLGTVSILRYGSDGPEEAPHPAPPGR